MLKTFVSKIFGEKKSKRRPLDLDGDEEGGEIEEEVEKEEGEEKESTGDGSIRDDDGRSVALDRKDDSGVETSESSTTQIRSLNVSDDDAQETREDEVGDSASRRGNIGNDVAPTAIEMEARSKIPASLDLSEELPSDGRHVCGLEGSGEGGVSPDCGGACLDGGSPNGCLSHYSDISDNSSRDGDVGGSFPSMAASFPALPPPKRKRPNRVIEEAEDWCETDANWKYIKYTWTINSFSKCQEELGNYVTSPEFPSSVMAVANPHGVIHSIEEDVAFYLKVHLKGENEDSDHLAVYIVCKGPEEVLASFELSIIVDGEKRNLRDSKKVCQFAEDQHPAWGFKKFILFDELKNEERAYLTGDRLKLHCEVKFVSVKNLHPVHLSWGDATFKSENRVEEGMERLDVDQLWRDRKLYADVTIICQDREIPANRVLLATRSEVFRAMFSHPTKEAESGRIEISDVEAAVFEQLLAYVYTGFAPNVDAIAEDLLIAANKYALEELKTDCVRVLESNLSVENVLEMLVLGDQHEAAKLKDAAFAFLVNRLDVFMDKTFKVQWHKFKEAHPELTTETVKVLLEKQPVAKFS